MDSAEIKIDGITVIAGLNGTGKSTVLKSLFSVVSASTDLDKILRDDIAKFIFVNSNRYSPENRTQTTDLDCLKEILEDQNQPYRIDKKEVQMMIDYLEGKSDKGSLYRTSLIRTLRSVFHNQARKMSADLGSIELIDGKNSVYTEIDSMGIGVNGNGVNFSSVSYIDTPLVLDHAAKSLIITTNGIHRDLLVRQLTTRNNNSLFKENIEENKTDEINKLFSKIIKGSFKREEHELVYSTEDHQNLHISNMASGIKIFSILRILVENGYINEGSLLLLDEPEIHLHPEWQLIFAEILTLLNKKLGTKIVLTTHSPQFLASIEAYCEKECVEANFYNFEEDGDGHNISEDVTGNTQTIYRPMAEAFNDAEKVVHPDE